jgi:hypothetical protein
MGGGGSYCRIFMMVKVMGPVEYMKAMEDEIKEVQANYFEITMNVDGWVLVPDSAPFCDDETVL